MKNLKEKIFVFAGMPRGGTTFMYYNLMKHPSVFLPYRKELDYFSLFFYKGEDWYLEHFKKIGGNQVSFDISPSYFLSKEAVERIKSFNRDIKVIIAVRDPVEFAISEYNQYNSVPRRALPFEDFIEGFYMHNGKRKMLVELRKNKVADCLKMHRDAFGDNLLLYSFDLFKRDPLFVLQAIESFAGMPRYFNAGNFDNFVFNAGGRKNIKAVSYLLNRDITVSLIRMLFPRRAIQFFNNAFNRASKKKDGQGKASVPDEKMRIAEAAFSDQRAIIASLFAEHEMQLGSGRPFPKPR